MDSFELNKIAAAVLLALLVGMAAHLTGQHLIHPKLLEKNVYIVAGAENLDTTAPVVDGAHAAQAEPIEPLLASANIEAGKEVAKKCIQCHTFDQGGPHRVGPNLWGIIGEGKGKRSGFAFSKGMIDKGGAWSFEDMNHFLYKPRDFIPGTKMTFAGLQKAQDRANLIAYLNSLSSKPLPLPQAAAAQPASSPPPSS